MSREEKEKIIKEVLLQGNERVKNKTYKKFIEKSLVIPENPWHIHQFLIKNNIPEKCSIHYDDGDDVRIYWEEMGECSDKENHDKKCEHFANFCWREIFGRLTFLGYKRICFPIESNVPKGYFIKDRLEIYKLYRHGDLEKILYYYCSAFSNEPEK